MKIELKQITQKDNAFYTICEWMKEWWEKEENLSYAETQAIMDRSISVTDFPRTYALFVDEKVVGAFQFTLFDLHVAPNIYPWLANVFVAKDERGKGYSVHLIEKAVSLAKNIGIKRLWLFTHHENLYERYGFKLEEMIDTFVKNPREQRLYSIKLVD